MRSLIVLLALFPTFSLAADKAHTPKPGSKERKAILDTIRTPLQKELKQPLLFRVDHLKVQDGWAFLIGTPRTKDDQPIDYRKTRFSDDASTMDELLIVLMRLKDGRWKIIERGLFTTDVWWIGLDKEHGAPSTIFPDSKNDSQ